MSQVVRHSGFLVAAVACVAAGYDAAHTLTKSLSVSSTTMAPREGVVAFSESEVPSDTLSIWEAVDLDPFRKDRSAGEVRYRLPGTKVDTGPVAVVETPTIVLLLGTVMLSDGSGIALCQHGNEPPALIRPGQRIGGLTLKRVDQAKATFVSADGRESTLSVSKGGSS